MRATEQAGESVRLYHRHGLRRLAGRRPDAESDSEGADDEAAAQAGGYNFSCNCSAFRRRTTGQMLGIPEKRNQ